MHHRLSAVFVPRTSCVTRDHVFVDSGLCTAPLRAHAQRAQGARPDATNENFASAPLTLLRVKWQDAISMSLVTNVSCQSNIETSAPSCGRPSRAMRCGYDRQLYRHGTATGKTWAATATVLLATMQRTVKQRQRRLEIKKNSKKPAARH